MPLSEGLQGLRLRRIWSLAQGGGEASGGPKHLSAQPDPRMQAPHPPPWHAAQAGQSGGRVGGDLVGAVLHQPRKHLPMPPPPPGFRVA